MMKRIATLVVVMLAVSVVTDAQYRLRRGGPTTVVAPVVEGDLASLPLIDLDNDLEYLGGFKTPSATSNSEIFYGGAGFMEFNNVSGNTLYALSYGNAPVYRPLMAEITVETPSTNADLTTWNRATFVQGFFDPVEANNTNVTTMGSPGPFVIYNNGSGNRIYGSDYVYYDSSNELRHTYWHRSLTLSGTTWTGFAQMGDADRQGWISEILTVIPTAWQSALGGDMMGGGCCLSIVSRHSYGMNAISFNSSGIGTGTTPAVNEILGYPGTHKTLGEYSAYGDPGGPAPPTELWNMSTEIHGMVAIEGTRTLLYIGRHGTGESCYGPGTGNASWHGHLNVCPGPYCQAGELEGDYWCYDLNQSGKGTHAYPYRYQVWAYDMLDLAAVKAGTMNKWEPVPYAVAELGDIPYYNDSEVRLGGVGYDRTNKKLYIAQPKGEQGGSYQTWPLIYVYKINNIP